MPVTITMADMQKMVGQQAGKIAMLEVQLNAALTRVQELEDSISKPTSTSTSNGHKEDSSAIPGKQ